MEIIVPRYLAPGRRLIDGLIPPSPPAERRHEWQRFLRRYLPTFTGRRPQTQADFAVQGLINGGLVNGGHAMVDGGIIRAHVSGIASLQDAQFYYRWEGNSNDSSANANTLTPHGTSFPTYQTGKFGQSATFVRTNNDYYSIASNSTLQMGAGVDFTFSFWIFVDSGVCRLFDKGNFAGTSEYDCYWDGAVLYFQWNNYTPTMQTSSGLSTSTWINVIATVHPGASGVGSAFLYINNVQKVAQTAVTIPSATTNSLQVTIGVLWNLNFSQGLNGSIDSLGMWHRVISSAERAALQLGDAYL